MKVVAVYLLICVIISDMFLFLVTRAKPKSWLALSKKYRTQVDLSIVILNILLVLLFIYIRKH